MILIAHRGNLDGPNPERENEPGYLEEALAAGFAVEVDVWCVNDELYLGHDRPQHFIEPVFLTRPTVWCHAKNLEALHVLLFLGAHCFWHENDTVTLTSDNYIWTYPGKPVAGNSICLQFGPPSDSTLYKNAAGVCSDHIRAYRDDR